MAGNTTNWMQLMRSAQRKLGEGLPMADTGVMGPSLAEAQLQKVGAIPSPIYGPTQAPLAQASPLIPNAPLPQRPLPAWSPPPTTPQAPLPTWTPPQARQPLPAWQGQPQAPLPTRAGNQLGQRWAQAAEQMAPPTALYPQAGPTQGLPHGLPDWQPPSTATSGGFAPINTGPMALLRQRAPSIGSSVLPGSMTRNLTGGWSRAAKVGKFAEGVVPMIAWGGANQLVNNADPTKSIGPVDKSVLQGTTLGGTLGAFGGVPGSLAGATGVGAADTALNVAGGQLENEDNSLVALGKGGLRAVGGLGGLIMNAGDMLNTGGGSVSDLFSPEGKLGFTGIGGGGDSAEAQPEVVTPQNTIDRVFDVANLPPERRQELQSLYDIRVAAGDDPEQVASDIKSQTLQEWQAVKDEEKQLGQLAAQQAQAQKYMAPYLDSIRAQGQASQQLLQSMVPNLPAQMQQYGQYAAASAPMQANQLADSYAAQVALAPSQMMQQNQQARATSLQNQYQQMLDAAMLQQQFEASGVQATPLSSGI